MYRCRICGEGTSRTGVARKEKMSLVRMKRKETKREIRGRGIRKLAEDTEKSMVL